MTPRSGKLPAVMVLSMLRGEIVLCDLNLARGSEANKLRPCLIVSNDRANTASERIGRGVITVVPVTSNIVRVYPFQVVLPAEDTGLPVAAKAQAEQVRSIDVSRLGAKVGRVPPRLMAEVDEALRFHLAL